MGKSKERSQRFIHSTGITEGFGHVRFQHDHVGPFLQQSPAFCPAGKLTSHIAWVHVSGQKESGFKYRLIADNFNQFLEFYTYKMP